jgi:hypothetical protein
MPAKSNKKNGAADTSAPTDTIPFNDAVSTGKKILAQIADVTDSGQWQLGELADRVEPKYRDRTQARFAKALGIAPCTLKRYLSVYRAWKGIIGAPGPQSVSYSVLRELATHPQRAQILRDNPKITKQEAHEKMRDKGTGKKGAGNGKGSSSSQGRRWATKFVNLIDEVIDEAAIVDQPMTREQRYDFFMACEPDVLVPKAREASDLLHRLAEFLVDLPTTLSAERDCRAKANAAISAQAAV